MSYQPTDLDALQGNVTHGGAANTTQTDTILAAPGAGLRYRIWMFTITFDDVNATPVCLGSLDFSVQNVSFIRWAISVGDPGATIVIPGGYPGPENQAVRLRNWKANAAAGTTLRWALMWTNEAIG